MQLRCAAAEAIRGCPPNQTVFAGMTGMDGNRPRPALVTLVIDLLAFRNPFDYRCASLYCLECFLYKVSCAYCAGSFYCTAPIPLRHMIISRIPLSLHGPGFSSAWQWWPACAQVGFARFSVLSVRLESWRPCARASGDVCEELDQIRNRKCFNTAPHVLSLKPFAAAAKPNDSAH